MKKRKKRSGRRIRGSLARTPTKTKTKTRNVKRKKKGRKIEQSQSSEIVLLNFVMFSPQLFMQILPDSLTFLVLNITPGSMHAPRTSLTITPPQKSLKLSISCEQFTSRSTETFTHKHISTRDPQPFKLHSVNFCMRHL